MIWSYTEEPLDATMRKIDCLKVISASRGKEKPKKIWIEKVKNDIKAFDLADKIVPELTKWKHKNHIADRN